MWLGPGMASPRAGTEIRGRMDWSGTRGLGLGCRLSNVNRNPWTKMES